MTCFTASFLLFFKRFCCPADLYRFCAGCSSTLSFHDEDEACDSQLSWEVYHQDHSSLGCEVDVEDHHCEVEDHHVSSSWVLSSLVFHVGGRGGSGTALCFGTAWRFGSAGASPSAILGPVGLCVLFIFSILPSHLEKTSDQQAGHKVKPRFDSTRFFEPASWPIKTSKLAKEPSDLKTDQQAGQSAQHLFIHSSDCFPN